MLGQMEAREPGLVGKLDQLQTILEQSMRRRARNVLDVVENAEGGSGHDDASSRVESVQRIRPWRRSLWRVRSGLTRMYRPPTGCIMVMSTKGDRRDHSRYS